MPSDLSAVTSSTLAASLAAGDMSQDEVAAILAEFRRRDEEHAAAAKRPTDAEVLKHGEAILSEFRHRRDEQQAAVARLVEAAEWCIACGSQDDLIKALRPFQEPTDV